MLVRKALTILFCIVLLSEVIFSARVQGESVSQPSNWAVDSIEMADKLGITLQSDSIYYQENITREAFCELIVSTYEKASGNQLTMEGENPFIDTDNEQVLKAYEKGIIKGITSTEFKPDNLITRQELAVMMLRALKALELDMDKDFIVEKDSKSIQFNDEASVASWAKEDLKSAYFNDLINGIGVNQIQPRGNTTNEQAIVMAMRLYMICYNKSHQTKHLWNDIDYIDENGELLRVVTDLKELGKLKSFKSEGIQNVCAATSNNIVLKADGSVWIKTWTAPLIDGNYDYANKADIWINSGLSNMIGVFSCDYYNYYALRVDGTVWTWHESDYTQNVTTIEYYGTYSSYTTYSRRSEQRVNAVQMKLSADIIGIDGYESNIIALSNQGNVYIWDSVKNPMIIDGLSDVIKVNTYSKGYSALKKDGTVWEWTRDVELDGSTKLTKPILSKALTDVLDIEYGVNHILVLKNDGSVYTLGDNKYGQLGYLEDKTTDTLQKVKGLEDIIEINANSNSNLVMNKNGQIFYFGNYTKNGISYKLLTQSIVDCEKTTLLRTDGMVLEYYTEFTRAGGYYCKPVVEVPAMKQVHLIDDKMALQKNGALWSWEYPELHTSANWEFAVHKIGLLPEDMMASDFIDMTSNKKYIFILDKNGSLWALYTFDYYVNKLAKIGMQTPIKIMDDVLMVSENSVLKKDGTVWKIDENDSYLFNDETQIPLSDCGLSNVTAISAEEGHTIALKGDGTVWYFGKTTTWNPSYGTSSYSASEPIQINGIINATSVQAINGMQCDGIITLKSGEVQGFYYNIEYHNYEQYNNYEDVAAVKPILFNIGIDNLKMIKSDGVSETIVKKDGSCYNFFYRYDFYVDYPWLNAPEGLYLPIEIEK